MTLAAYLETFAPHYQELRKRLVRSVLAVTLAASLAYVFKDKIAAFCIQPLYAAYPDLEHLVYTKLTEAFIAYIKLALIVGLLGAFPVVLYQIWMFVSPGMLAHEKQLARRIVFWASLLFYSGAVFAFFAVLPRTLLFFMSYAGENLIPRPKLGLYLTFVARLSLAFGIAFQIPFLMVMSSATGLISADHFRRKRLWFYAAIAVLSFLLTAGDITAAALLLFPLLALYESGLLIGSLLAKKNPPA